MGQCRRGNVREREKIIQIFLKAGFAIQIFKVKRHLQEIQFLEIKWQDGYHHIAMDVTNKITAMFPPADKNETQTFLGIVDFWLPCLKPTV